MTQNINRPPVRNPNFTIKGVPYEVEISVEDGQGWRSMPDYYTATLKGHPELSVRIEEGINRDESIKEVTKRLRDKVRRALSRGNILKR